MEDISLNEIKSTLNEIKENMVSKEELESYIETIEVMLDTDNMKSIHNSLEDISKGNIKEVNSFNDLVKEL